MTKSNLGLAALLGMLTVLLGAFGAHSLEDKLEPEALKSFETGIRYMMFHVLALLVINSSSLLQEKSKKRISLLFFAGVLLFSGSIFLISLGVIPASQIWFVTPIGGILLILSWLITAVAFFKSNHKA
jgi:uncharacterized membrane protein YgdD (TMEM256/DUF423 family)